LLVTRLTLPILVALLLLAGTLEATAEPRVERPTWDARKRAELRAERDALRAENRTLRRTLRHRPDVQEAMRLSSLVYGVPLNELRRVTWCESRWNPRAQNRTSTAAGLAQFLDSTWARTPYRSENVYSAHANALAAGWLWRANGGSWREWVCRP
jgi:muramidase (phage lysozyme)